MGKLSIYNVIRYLGRYRTFFESGSYKGDTIMELLNHFNKLYTIELNEDLYNHVSKRFTPFSKVTCLQGDSKKIIREISPILPDYTIFYLDAHWSGDNTVNWDNSLWKGYDHNTSYVGNAPTAENQVPLAEELRAIVECYSGNAIILIDDIEVIGTKDLKFVGEDWSHLSIKLLETIISPRRKSFEIVNSTGSPMGIVMLHSTKKEYWSDIRTHRKISIHNRDYIVELHEFKELEVPEYYPMILREDVAHLDRLIYILNKLSLSILFTEYEYGGYIMSNLKIKSYLFTNRLIDPEVLKNVQIVNELRNVSIIYSSSCIDNNSLILISRRIMEIEGRKKYSLEDITHFYVKKDYCAKFEKRVKTNNGDIIDNNLMQLLIMVKNAGNGFYDMLKHNVPLFDNYIILDTGSTDNTIEAIERVIEEYPHGQLHLREWKGFRDSRNELLDMAGKEYVFNVMLDDTYYLNGNLRSFLSNTRSDDVAQSFSIYIQDDFTTYISNRVTKSLLGLRYMYRLHEIIENNTSLKIPYEVTHIIDKTSPYMTERTYTRKREDLQLQLLDHEELPFDTNVLYHLAESYVVLKEYENAFDTYAKCVSMAQIATKEQIQDSYYKMATLALFNLSQEFILSRGNMNWKDYYLKAYETIPERPEALYIIGYHYMSINNVEEAYYWLEKAYRVNINMISKPNMNAKHKIYDKEIYQCLIPLAYIKANYTLGLDCCTHMKGDDEFKNFWLSVFYLLVEYYKNVRSKMYKQNITCFIAPGGWNRWDGSTLATKGLGGTETAIVRFAETMAKNRRVVVLCNCEHDKLYNGVTYINIYNAPEFFASNEVETCYINRFPEYIPLCSKAGVRNIYLILHDILRNYEQFLDVDRIKKVFLLSEWHRAHFLDRIKLPTSVISYGIDIPVSREKRPFSLIYPNFPNRGLIHLLDIFPRIRAKYSHAVLNVFCDLDHPWCNNNYPDMMREIREKINQDGVINHGWVNESTLKMYWSTSHVWLYPCIFKETYCRVCLEAAANKVLMISNDLAALAENNQGVIVPGDITQEWKERALDILFDFFEHEERYSHIIERCYQWAKARSYDDVVKLLE